jgi:hypothetical protein
MPGLTMFSAMRFQIYQVSTNSIDSKTITLVSPLGEGGLYAAQTVCVGFLPFPGEGAASWEAAMKKGSTFMPVPFLLEFAVWHLLDKIVHLKRRFRHYPKTPLFYSFFLSLNLKPNQAGLDFFIDIFG